MLVMECSTNGEWPTAVADFVAHLRAGGRAAGTVKVRRYYVESLAAGVEAGPWAVDGHAVTAWAAGQAWQAETRRSARASVRSFFGWAVQDGRRADNPALALLPVPAPPPLPRPVPDDAYLELLGAVDERTRLMVRLGAELGLRRAEIAQVHLGDLEPDLIGVSLRVRGKGGRVRLIPLPAPLAATLSAACRAGGGWAFPGRDGGHLSADRVGRLVGQAMPAGMSTHALRHRFATRAYRVGNDLLAVQTLLGHVSPVTTRRYVALEDGRLRRTVLGAG